MRKYEHGGDIYAEDRRILDFSVNINPLGMPGAAVTAAEKAARQEQSYPDPFCRKLTQALSERYGLPSENIVCGNGASDIIIRLCAALRPEKVFVPAPGFSEYGRSAALFGAEVCEYAVYGFAEGEESGLSALLEKEYPASLSESSITPENNISGGIDTAADPAAPPKVSRSGLYSKIAFVCRPNNPDGSMMRLDELRDIAESCRKADCLLAVDECFLEFTDDTSALVLLDRFRNVLVINAFTKTYAMAGLRLGFAFSSDTKLLDDIYRYGIPWSVSSAAQSAGAVCCEDTEFLAKSRRFIAEERKRLISAIESAGLKVFPSAANFLLIKVPVAPEACSDAAAGEGRPDNNPGNISDGYVQRTLRGKFAAQGIKVRDCRSFTCLDDSYIRIGIRTKDENDAFIKALKYIFLNGV